MSVRLASLLFAAALSTTTAHASTSTCTDNDGDGYCGYFDCDDTNDEINRLATEICDGIDNDCDGFVDAYDWDLEGDGACFAESTSDTRYGITEWTGSSSTSNGTLSITATNGATATATTSGEVTVTATSSADAVSLYMDGGDIVVQVNDVHFLALDPDVAGLQVDLGDGDDVYDASGITTSLAGGHSADGGDDDDLLIGSDYADVLDGGSGNDTLYGHAGKDTLTGDDGTDTLYGHDDGDLGSYNDDCNEQLGGDRAFCLGNALSSFPDSGWDSRMYWEGHDEYLDDGEHYHLRYFYDDVYTGEWDTVGIAQFLYFRIVNRSGMEIDAYAAQYTYTDFFGGMWWADMIPSNNDETQGIAHGADATAFHTLDYALDDITAIYRHDAYEEGFRRAMKITCANGVVREWVEDTEIDVHDSHHEHLYYNVVITPDACDSSIADWEGSFYDGILNMEDAIRAAGL